MSGGGWGGTAYSYFNPGYSDYNFAGPWTNFAPSTTYNAAPSYGSPASYNAASFYGSPTTNSIAAQPFTTAPAPTTNQTNPPATWANFLANEPITPTPINPADFQTPTVPPTDTQSALPVEQVIVSADRYNPPPPSTDSLNRPGPTWTNFLANEPPITVTPINPADFPMPVLPPAATQAPKRGSGGGGAGAGAGGSGSGKQPQQQQQQQRPQPRPNPLLQNAAYRQAVAQQPGGGVTAQQVAALQAMDSAALQRLASTAGLTPAQSMAVQRELIDRQTYGVMTPSSSPARALTYPGGGAGGGGGGGSPVAMSSRGGALAAPQLDAPAGSKYILPMLAAAGVVAAYSITHRKKATA